VQTHSSSSLPTYRAVVADLRIPLHRLGRSFGYALRGILIAAPGANMRIHLVAAGAVTLVAAARGVTGARLAVVALTVGVVLAAELFNTAIERICDFVAGLHGIGHDERIRDIKDLSAGAVLVTALAAVVVAATVFT
jgi:diacylglycerol kinase (ATP)